MTSTVQRAEIIAESAVTLLARVEDSTGANVTQSAVSAISGKVFDRTTGEQTGTVLPLISSTIYNTLQTDSRWTTDAIGYCFSLTVPGSCFPIGGTTYRVEVLLTPTGGNGFYLLWDLQATAIYSQ